MILEVISQMMGREFLRLEFLDVCKMRIFGRFRKVLPFALNLLRLILIWVSRMCGKLQCTDRIDITAWKYLRLGIPTIGIHRDTYDCARIIRNIYGCVEIIGDRFRFPDSEFVAAHRTTSRFPTVFRLFPASKGFLSQQILPATYLPLKTSCKW